MPVVPMEFCGPAQEASGAAAVGTRVQHRKVWQSQIAVRRDMYLTR